MAFLVPFFNSSFCEKMDVLITNNDEQWFRVSDIARLLGFYDSCSIVVLDGDTDVRLFKNSDLPGVNLRCRHARFFSRESLLKFLNGSSRPEAMIILQWVLEEVLPSLDAVDFNVVDAENAFNRYLCAKAKHLRAERNERMNTTIRTLSSNLLSTYLNSMSIDQLQRLQGMLENQFGMNNTGACHDTTA